MRTKLDVLVVGAGFAGLYQLYRLRRLGLSVKVIESAADVGGTWYWNRYPGARCDIESIDYSYSFDAELEAQWQWSERYATQPEILRYLGHVADKHDLRRDILFGTRVESAHWNESAASWLVRTVCGREFDSRFCIMATGCLSLPKAPDIPGYDSFRGQSYYTGRWPHERIDFTGKRVAVIGTGSSGVQSIPLIARQAASLTVFQRTPNFSRPAFNGPVPAAKKAAFEADRRAYRESARWSMIGVPMQASQVGVLQVPDEQRHVAFEAAYASGELLAYAAAFADVGVNPQANEAVCEHLRGKIRALVHDAQTAEDLCPKDHFYGTKRPCIDSQYYETFNLPNVRLVDLRKEPMTRITERGIDTVSRSFEFDAIIFATGFDAMTGPVVAVDIRGRGGLALKQKWRDGPTSYLGLTMAGFPNLFLITGPGSPSVLSNMVVSIEQHVDWISDCIAHMRVEGFDAIEATSRAEAAWVQHVNDCADITLHPRANSWYMGANVAGKPRVFLPYIGGVDRYRRACDEVVSRGYLGFSFTGLGGTRCNDGAIRRVQPDVSMLLETLAGLGLPPMESLSAQDARALMLAMSASRPPGPSVGETIDGELPGSAGNLAYRLYRPATLGPHPIVVYFHGGGWVLGNSISDEPFCRDLCVQANVILISVDYRHAPEHRFPAAALDAFAAIKWVAAHSGVLGGIPGKIGVCGWSAGGNIAAVACQMARDAGAPRIDGQILVNPVTDFDLSGGSAIDNADGYLLTTTLMRWFWDHYADIRDRADPRASPLRAPNLSRLPPALIVTCEFDPLRDQGIAYADALAAAGVSVRHLAGRGQIHSSLTSVDVILSAAAARAEIAQWVRQLFT